MNDFVNRPMVVVTFHASEVTEIAEAADLKELPIADFVRIHAKRAAMTILEHRNAVHGGRTIEAPFGEDGTSMKIS